MSEPGSVSMLTSLSGEPRLVDVLDTPAEEDRDAFVDEGGLGALFLRAEDCESGC